MPQFALTISGKSSIMDKIDDTKEISVAFKRLACCKVDKTSLDNGDYEYNYKFKNLDEVTIIEGDKVVRGKSKSKKSIALRNRIWLYHNTEGLTQDFDEFYEQTMNIFIENIEEILKTKIWNK